MSNVWLHCRSPHAALRKSFLIAAVLADADAAALPAAFLLRWHSVASSADVPDPASAAVSGAPAPASPTLFAAAARIYDRDWRRLCWQQRDARTGAGLWDGRCRETSRSHRPEPRDDWQAGCKAL